MLTLSVGTYYLDIPASDTRGNLVYYAAPCLLQSSQLKFIANPERYKDRVAFIVIATYLCTKA